MSEIKRFAGFGIAMLQESPAREYVLASDYDSLAAQLRAVEGDARRYRWLRSLGDANQFDVYDMTREPLLLHTEYLDAAIDQAIAHQDERGEWK